MVLANARGILHLTQIAGNSIFALFVEEGLQILQISFIEVIFAGIFDCCLLALSSLAKVVYVVLSFISIFRLFATSQLIDAWR